MSAEQGPSAGEYIVHHLTHLQNKPMSGVIDFSVFNIDSIFWSITLGLIGCFVLWRAASTATSGAPGRFQAAVEIMFELVDSQAKGIIHNAESRKLVAPLALTVFVWIFCSMRWTCSLWTCFLCCSKQSMVLRAMMRTTPICA